MEAAVTQGRALDTAQKNTAKTRGSAEVDKTVFLLSIPDITNNDNKEEWLVMLQRNLFAIFVGSTPIPVQSTSNEKQPAANATKKNTTKVFVDQKIRLLASKSTTALMFSPLIATVP